MVYVCVCVPVCACCLCVYICVLDLALNLSRLHVQSMGFVCCFLWDSCSFEIILCADVHALCIHDVLQECC